MNTIRQSNFELLRVIAALMVLVLHADFFSLEGPSVKDITQHPFDATLNVGFQFLTVSAVNIFVMISGWFGIRQSFKGGANILFQAWYYLLITFVITSLLQKSAFSTSSILMLTLISGNWFVKAYLILYLLAPALNYFADLASREQFKYVLISYVGFIFVFGWIFHKHVDWICDGYSPIWFIALYLTARYMRRFSPKFLNISINNTSLKIRLTR